VSEPFGESLNGHKLSSSSVYNEVPLITCHLI
jgi:hypothetical protein